MTMGQRIALKRRELGLSQEGLGERLGVSRQAIYKWESDTALPEIEKLVNLSREFSVSVGWLLGEEDETAEKQELTSEQLRIVEEIVGRYLVARAAEASEKKPSAEPDEEPETPPKKRRWPYVLGAAAAVAVLAAFVSLFSRLDRLNQDYQTLQSSVFAIRTVMNTQINSFTSRMEEALQKQNILTTEQSVQMTGIDYRANTVTVEARVVPRTYVEGMTAEFFVISDGENVTVPGSMGENYAFTASITGPLSDEITVSAAFLTGEQRQTQVLEQFFNRYSDSLPYITVSGRPSGGIKTEGDPGWTVPFESVTVYCPTVWQLGDSTVRISLRVGLFRDWKLVQWFTEEEHDGNRHTFLPEQETFLLETGHSYCIAAVAEDEFGREWVVADEHGGWDIDKHWPESYMDAQYIPPYLDASKDPADWEY